MHDINDYIKNFQYPIPPSAKTLANVESAGTAIIEFDHENRRTYVVLVNGKSYGMSAYDLGQQERFIGDDRRNSLYNAISRAHCKVLSTIGHGAERLAILHGINTMTATLQALDEFRCPRLEAAQKDAMGEEAMTLFEGNATLATAEACYLTYPTFNYTPISETVDGIKVESVVQWARNNLKFVLSHEAEAEDGHGQRLQRWLVVRLTSDWVEVVNAELRKFAAIVDLLKTTPTAKEKRKEPTVKWTCKECGTAHETVIPRIYRTRRETLNIKCSHCDAPNQVADK